uniref:Major facilitator superfamily (MFS) profile domain-containing protein n=1 Tax=Esox lucius TaxID=8010 RepID=A0A3P8ZQ43_ESOLU
MCVAYVKQDLSWEKMRDYDDIILFLGEFGRFQIAVFVLLSLSALPNGYVGMSMVFLADIPDHRCKLPLTNSSENGDQHVRLATEEYSRRVGPDMCSRYKKTNNTAASASEFGNETEGCLEGWNFSTEKYTSTIVSEWVLVCDNAWKVPFSTSIFFLGVLIGSFISGHLSDRFGRKPVFFSTMAFQTIITLIQSTSINWPMFCVLNCLRGVGQISNYISSLVLGSEILGKSTRGSYTLLGHSVAFGVGYACLPLFAYFIRGWRMLLVASAIPCVFFIPLWWVIPESPRWLLSQGRVEEAELVIKNAAKMNRVPAPEVIFRADECTELTPRSRGEVQQVCSFLDLFQTADMRNITIVSLILWTATCMIFYGLSLNTANMSGDSYLNCFISATTEIVAYVGTWLLINHAQRPTILFSSLLFCGIMLLVIRLVPDDQIVLSQVLALLGKLGVSGAYSFLYLFSTELFPTVVRNMGLGVASMAARVGSILSPYVLYIGVYNKILPYIIFGIISLFSAGLSLLLPDTRGCKLPENISQVKPIRRITLNENRLFSNQSSNFF